MRNSSTSAVVGAGVAGVALLAAAGAAMLRSSHQKRRARMRDKVVVITGGSRGLGLALAEEFAALGARLVIAARDAEELNRAKVLLAQKAPGAEDRILTVQADLRNAEQAKQLIERATEHFGRVDILVNNAGVMTVGPVEHQTVDTFHDAMYANFFSGVYCALAALPQMQARRSGMIVNIASIGGKVAVPHMLAYTASKFAAVGFSQGLHAELRSKGVHVLTVCPGLMRTGSHLNASFAGDAPREYRWFSLLATTPGISVSARHAARRIVRAILWRETEVAISPQAAIAARLAQAVPSLTTRAMGATNRMLPKPAGTSEIRKGSDAREHELQPASRLSRRAAQRYNQSAA